jgi:hypothetical protein
MAILDRIKSFFKRPKTTAPTKPPEPAAKVAKEEIPQAPEQKAGETSQK